MKTLELFAVPATHQRRDDDAYYTPRPLAFALCRELSRLVAPPGLAGVLPKPGLVVEPSCGGGAFLEAARFAWPGCRLVGYDIRPEAIADLEARGRRGADQVLQADWLDPALVLPGGTGANLVLGNPPFADAQTQIEAALRRLAPGGHLAFLLRVSLLGSVERARTLWRRPGLRYLLPVAPRPSFTSGGNDTADVSLFVWEEGYAGRAELLPPLIWGSPR